MTVFLIDFIAIKISKGRVGRARVTPRGPALRSADRLEEERSPGSASMWDFPGLADEAKRSKHLSSLPAAFVLKYESSPVPCVVFFYCCGYFRGATFSVPARHSGL